jgi:hypothetical protein
LLESLKQWLEATLCKLSRKSDTALAVRYALGRWEALLRYVDNGPHRNRQQRRKPQKVVPEQHPSQLF